VSDILDEKTALGLLKEFPLLDGPLEKFELLPQGLFNENAQLIIAGQKYVLKKMATGRSVERHRYGATLQKVLAEGGFPCPAVVVNKNGDVISEYQGRMWSIQTWAEGSNCSDDLKNGSKGSDIRSDIGTAVGKLHALASQAQIEGKLPPAPDDAQLSLTSMLARINTTGKGLFSGSLLRPSKARRLKLSLNKTPLQKEVVALLPTLEKGCQQLENWDPGPHPELSTTGTCHGDINWENLFFKEARLTAVLDFDNAMEMSPAFDAVAAAAVVCGSNAEFQDAFFKAYSLAGGIDIDPSLIPPLMLMKYVRSLLFQVGVAMSDGTGNDALASKWMAFLGQNIAHLVKTRD